MESVIKWQTGESEKVGFYLVSTSKNEVLINHVTIDEKGDLMQKAYEYRNTI